ncbi:amino acid/amide ABC transporter substrate-binding protein (HAAT family) [Halanaerobium saccharolyticum]|uniref:Amino acid/amide ABC transporter substrate-binding protein (HAAT family) n=1 Tax=Halanaerobium saccharolyticum TaxID=43595 RepID=A0A4R6M2M5_9FIRM|nr:ABC transporter substrate-binding protein [Halanaerobium saccharolyticum]MEC9489561.1 ABC transporter substrate-binding protein [Halanaerobiales bacterium]TDO94650.1 amino acid/amide ABC transporter substrate-binding protein (HAAT family) [Halanaerobium saccharolyticum]
MFKKKILITMLVLLFLSLTVSGAFAQETVKIGTLMPLTGGLASYGQFTRNGTLLAQKIINEQGGLLGGRELELVNVDTQTNPQAGVDGAKKLVSINGVNAIVGALSSGVTIPVAESVTVPGEVVLISPASTSPVLTTLEDNGYVFRTVPSDSLQGKVAGNLAADLNYDSLAVIYVNNDYGQGLNDAVIEQFEKRGGEVTASIAFEPNKVSYRSELMDAAEENPDALLLIAYTDDGGITIIRQALENGYFKEFIFTDGLKAPEITEGVEQYLEGMYGTAPTAMPGGQGPELFTELYEEEFGEIPPKPYIDTSFDATFVLALAMQKAGSTEGPAIRDALNEVLSEDGTVVNINEWNKAKDLIEAGQKIRYEGASGPVLFNDVGDSMGAIGIWKIENGNIVDERLEVQ